MATEEQVRRALARLGTVPSLRTPQAAGSAFTEPPTRVLVVSDEPLLRTALAEQLASTSDLLRVVTADREDTARSVAELQEVDVVVAALRPPSRIRAMVDFVGGVPLLALDHLESAGDIDAALRRGATGVLSRRADARQIRDAVLVVRHGIRVQPSVVLEAPVAGDDDSDHEASDEDGEHGSTNARSRPAVVDLTQVSAGAPGSAEGGRRTTPVGPLTNRESQIVQLLVDGYSVKQIASRLGIALQTAKNHIHHIMSKAGVSTRLQLYTWARAQGFRETVRAGSGADPQLRQAD